MAKESEHWDVEGDIVVVGSGSGALTSAIVGREYGKRVTLLECTDKLGGGTAYSGGMVWVANNHHMKELSIDDSREDALAYLHSIGGGRTVEDMAQAFVDYGPQMLKYIEDKTGLEMEVIRPCPDYYAELPGGKMEGRYMVPKLYDTKKLGDWQPILRTSPHFPFAASFSEMEAWGGFTKMRDWDWELIGQRIQQGIVGFGISLIAPLMKACIDRNVNIMLQTRAIKLLQDDNGRVVGVEAKQDNGQSLSVQGKLGVILACGGYEWNKELRLRTGSPTTEAFSVPSNRGDGHLMALEIGAGWVQLDDGSGPCLSIPDDEHDDGQQLYRLFNLEPARPHLIMVNRQGKRFGDEAFWRSFDQASIRFDATTQSYPNLPYFGIFDQNCKDKYAIGTSMPGDEAPGWMIRAQSIRELAVKMEIDPDNLEETVTTFNKYSMEGRDPFFHRGEAAYDRHWGDHEQKPNPTLGPIEKPPYYGIKLVRGCAGTRSGLLTNNKAQVINVRGAAIHGLYAVPNVAAHLAMGLGYTSGMNHAQSMIFGYIATMHMTE